MRRRVSNDCRATPQALPLAGNRTEFPADPPGGNLNNVFFASIGASGKLASERVPGQIVGRVPLP
ncbi:MAG: hypothetical protein ACREUQ_05405 [Burkholderiales bacterium]